jgi:hypothetical protein
MSSASSGWLPLILSTLGGGVVGSLIATYTSQIHERRNARVQALRCLGRAETLTRSAEASIEETDAALLKFDAAAMVAGLPKSLVHFHRFIQLLFWVIMHVGDPVANRHNYPAGVFLAERTNRLLYATIWHPWRTRSYSWYVIYRYKRLRQADLVLHGTANASMPERYSIPVFDRKQHREVLRNWRRIKRSREHDGQPDQRAQGRGAARI